MSLFSEINGFNANAIKNINIEKELKNNELIYEDFSDVDFCINDKEINLFVNGLDVKNNNEVSIFE